MRCLKFVAGAILVCLTSAASAVTTLVGGGSTSSAIGYSSSATVPAPLVPITPGSGSLFRAYSSAGGDPLSYCPTGGGVGDRILAGNDPTNFQVNGLCGGSSPSGFGGIGLTQAHYAASDAPMSQTEFNAFGTQPVQLPSVAGAIGLVFRKTGVTSMTLTEGQICGIFAGQIRDWSDPGLSGAVPAGTSGPITVVYSKEVDGVSFSFLNHLSAVCPSNTAGGRPAATAYQTSQSFPGLGTLGGSLGASMYIPLYQPSIGTTFDADVPATVNLTNGSIGYAEVANAVRASTRIASVTNSHTGITVSPLTGFGPTAIPVNLLYDMVLADTVDVMGRPVLSTLSTTSQCIAVVDPLAYADPSAGYPILSINYLLAHTLGNGSDVGAVRDLLFSPYKLALRSSVTTIGRIGTGYAWLSNAALTQGKVDGCIN